MFAFWLLVCALAACFAWILCRIAGFGSRSEERAHAIEHGRAYWRGDIDCPGCGEMFHEVHR